MEIVRARLTPIRLPIRIPLDTAHGVTRHRSGLLLRLETRDGLRGHGEALPLPGFGVETEARAREALLAGARALLGRDPRPLRDALDAAARNTRRAPCARAALDTALHDLVAQARGVRVSALLGGACRSRVAVGALLAAKTPREVGRAAREAVERGYRTLKLKVGATTVDRDVARASGLREAVGDEVALRLDANGGWDERTALEALARLAPLAPEYVEQPVPADELDALARVRNGSPVPIAADESVTTGGGARAVLERGAADVIVVKPAALGGLRAAREVAEAARAAGVEVVVTGFLDSAVGDTAALHLAAALGAPHAAGLGTAELFEKNCALIAASDGGFRSLPDAPGLGIEPDPARVAALTHGSAMVLCA